MRRNDRLLLPGKVASQLKDAVSTSAGRAGIKVESQRSVLMNKHRVSRLLAAGSVALLLLLVSSCATNPPIKKGAPGSRLAECLDLVQHARVALNTLCQVLREAMRIWNQQFNMVARRLQIGR